MPRLAEQVLAALHSPDPAEIRDGCLLAMSFFEARRGPNIQPAIPEARSQPATEEEIGLMKSGLTDIASNSSRPDMACAALSALGELDDSDLVPFFIECVGRYRDIDAGAMYQAMIALDNQGRQPFDEPSPWSVREAERNRAMADRFLARVSTT